ncbi:cyclic nucleotide-binding protein [Sporanaerobium hydrogeniformans]|uniref:Cyclic nucleotide-binding protein n=1 Tax=Sporanaerobium hydrogeniformans TaxID=3072179 RepID=A0AC61DBX9_9FIRM|nr:Crp/Fnr family transcriptional regulator [Sporanaerobium hydrogeniformans]PHV70542.1 cyclic nucleotide-binding protein [Sporanaerobium hydrogeniformans]
MKLLEELKKDYAFLNTLSEEVQHIIEQSLCERKYKAGYKLINSEQVCCGFSFILQGTLRVYRINEEGREVTLYRLKKGDSCFMTILCALTHQPTFAFAEVEEEAILAIVPISIFEHYLLNDVNYLKYSFQNLYGKFDSVVNTLEKITFDSIEKRILDYLDAYKEHSKTNIIYTTHEKLAIDIGSSREVVSRILKGFEKKGIVALERGKIRIL